jgi:rare lipoprotein A (peptidoglycan hydrolase)
MVSKSILRLKTRLVAPRFAAGAGALLTLTTAAAALMLTAPGSQAHSSLGRGTQSAAHRHPGFHRGIASWYYDDHSETACGFHAKFGVAHRTLPCHTKVTFWHNHHRVVAVVDDRGPYIVGRTWDLDEHTAAALHFSGVAGVWAKW